MTGGPVNVAPAKTSAPLRLWVPGMQAVASGVPVDRSQYARTATRGAALTDAASWANAGYITTGEQAAGSNGGFSYPAETFDWNAANGDSFLLSFEIRKGSVPGAEKQFLGNAAVTGVGLQLRMDTAGRIKVGLGDGTVSKVSAGSDNVCDNTDRSVQVWWDADFRQLMCRAGNTHETTDAYQVTGSTLGTNPFAIGYAGNVSSNGTLAVRIRNIQLYVWKAQGLPTNWRRGVERLRANRYQPIADWSAL